MYYRDIIDGLASVHENTHTDYADTYFGKPLKVGNYNVCAICGSLYTKDDKIYIYIETKNANKYPIIKLPNSYIRAGKECTFLGVVKGNDKQGYSVSDKVSIYSPTFKDDSISSDDSYYLVFSFKHLSDRVDKSDTITVKGKTVQDVFMNTCKKVESYIQKNYLDVLKEYLPLDKAYKFVCSAKFDKLYNKYKDKPINFDDTPIVVYKNDKVEYEGILDNCPYKDDDWKQLEFCRGIYYLYDDKKDPSSLYIMVNNE